MLSILCWYQIVSATGLDLIFSNLTPSLQWWTFPVQFIWGGNNYAGSLIFKDNMSPVNKEIVFLSWTPQETHIFCKKQIHGYYFNAARWAGLLPLSTQTQTNDGVTVWGWLYTSCWNGARIFDLVGMLDYKKDWNDMGKVVFWVDTNTTENKSNGNYSAWAISWKVANGVNGNFFDTMFGIGTVSTTNTSTGTIGTVSNLIGTFTNIYIQWHVGIGQSVDTIEREILTINLAWTKTLLTSSDEVLSSTVLNTVEKNRAQQCRNSSPNNKLICNNDWWLYIIDKNNIDEYAGKDVVFTNGDVFIDESVYQWYKQSDFRKSLSLYIPDGNLIFASDISQDDLTNVDNNGFLTNNKPTTQWVYLVGNFIVNGIILWSRDQDFAKGGRYSTIPFKTFIHGKLVSLNTFTAVSEKRIQHLQDLMNDRTPNYEYFTHNEDLGLYFRDKVRSAGMGDIFAWWCSDTLVWWTIIINNWVSTTTWWISVWAEPLWEFNDDTRKAVTSIQCPIWHRYPLMIIEKNIPTLFFNK